MGKYWHSQEKEVPKQGNHYSRGNKERGNQMWQQKDHVIEQSLGSLDTLGARGYIVSSL